MENLDEYNQPVNSDHMEKSDLTDIEDAVFQITNDPMGNLEGTSQELLTLQPSTPSYTSFIEAPIINQGFNSGSDASDNFLIPNQDTEVHAVNQQATVLTGLGTPAVDNANRLIIILPTVDNPLLINESFQQVIPVHQQCTTMHQEISGNITIAAQSSSNQEPVSAGVLQSTTNYQVMTDNSLIAQNTTNQQDIENAISVHNANSNDKNMPSTSKPHTPKKRGRKPKYPEGRRPRIRKIKLYEMNEFDDPNRERRRLNAINARKHRALAKEKLEEAQKRLRTVEKERDMLKKEVEKYKTFEETLLKQLRELRDYDC